MARVEIASLGNGSVLGVGGSGLYPAAGAQVNVYQHGTKTPVSVFAAEAGATTLTQPLTVASTGAIPGWVTSGTRVDLEISYGGLIKTVAAEPIEAGAAGGGGGITQAEAEALFFKTTNIPDAWVIAGEVTVLTLPGPVLVPAADEELHLVRLDYKIRTGTNVKFKLQKNGVDITGFTGLEATKTAAHVTPTAVAVTTGDEITCVIESVSATPTGFSADLTVGHAAT